MKYTDKIKRFVETSNGRYEAPDGMVPSNNIATAKFEEEEYAILFVEELEEKDIPCSFNYESFDTNVVYFNESILAEILL